MATPQTVLTLIENFERNLDAYRSGKYNETQVRRDFIDPFFKALGWDMDNSAGYAEAYRDVIHEDAIRIGSAVKAPDYCFRIGGTRKFFLEAKKPSVCIKEEIPPAYQLRRYAWSAKLPLSVLSDFEEFAVYDCRVKPAKDDPASTARVFYCTFRDFAGKWDWIASIFSRDAVLKGSFDKYAETNKTKRGTAEVDADFLASMENWRYDLAKNLALRNPRLSQRELNFAVQRILDRIVFLRICEDRGLEDYGRLLALTNGLRIYPRLCQLFEQADTRYNSGLFHFQPERDRQEPPDELTLGLDVDDRLLRDLLKGLYYPDSPYEFSVLSADILGQVYEQFLGKVIRLTEGHQAKIEEKPEVRKAGGVYYTPTYIVDYIVRQTVGILLDDIAGRDRSADFSPLQRAKSDETGEIMDANAGRELKRPEGRAPSATAILNRVAKLRILDPACGSGSFLICAYQFLLDWHLQFYLANDPEKWAKGKKPALVQTTRGWRLTIAERKRILLTHIYGVDIDAQAVEVTKLSLLLKVLEGENQQTIEPLFRIFHERALPDLGNNIKCGNSLIGPDFYQQAELPLLTDDEKYRINVFDWRAEFPHIFRRATSTGELREPAAASPLDYGMPGVPLHGRYSYKKKKSDKAVPPPAPLETEWEGGFDAVIGNPPYVRIQGFPTEQIAYFARTYKSATGNFDLYIPFIERGFRLLRPSGRLGMITPNKFLRTDYGEGLRRVLAFEKSLSRIVDFGASQVFSATTYTCLLFLQRGGLGSFEAAQVLADEKSLAAAVFSARAVDCLSEKPWSFEDEATARLLAKLERNAVRLLDLPTDMSRGSSTGDDEVFVVEPGTVPLEREALRVPLFASDFGRYHFAPSGKWQVIFPYDIVGDTSRLISERDFRSRLPKTFAYLAERHAALKRRKQFKEWFGYSAPRNLELHDRAHIAVPLLADRGLFTLIPQGWRGRLCPMASGGFTITLGAAVKVKPEYVLGIVNSKLLFWRLRRTSNIFRGGWITCTKQYFGELPIRSIDFSNTSDRTMHDRMVSLAEQMLGLHQQLASARTPHEQTALERQIAATDAQIDRLVYQIYGLTEEEVKIVERA